jgi:surface polysaccharide O-acyltransferase-like enzyme
MFIRTVKAATGLCCNLFECGAPPYPSRNYFVDMARLAAIFFVILLHVDFRDLGVPGAMARSTARWAVPFFFIVSGYFSSLKSLSISNPQRRKTLFRLSKIVIFSNLIYIPYALMLGLPPVDGGATAIVIWLVTSGVAFHLWFLHSLLFSSTLISLANNQKTCAILSVILGCCVLILNYFHVGLQLGTIANAFINLAYGVPFLAAGILISKFPPTPAVSWAFVVGGATAHILEFFWILASSGVETASSREIYFGTPFLSMGIASLTILSTQRTGDAHPTAANPFLRLISIIGANYVLGIYIVHIYIRIVINEIARTFGVYHLTIFKGLSPIFILTGSALLLNIAFRVSAAFKRIKKGHIQKKSHAH